MSASGRFIVNRILFQKILSALAVIGLTLFPLLASAPEDPCRETGIYIGNQTMLDVWYTQNGGAYTIFATGHLIIIKPEDTLIIYRDMICKAEYCSNNPIYNDYIFLDDNQTCRVRILPECNVSAMLDGLQI